MKGALKSAARSLFHHAGGTWLTRFRYRNGVRILMYHRFPEQSHLEAQCAHLKKYYRPASLTDVGLWLQKRKEIPPQTVVFTVDDGYRDFFLNAFPVLSAYSIPAIVFLATDMLDQRTCLWVDRVGILFRASPLDEVTLNLPGKGPARFRLASDADRKRAAFETKEALKQAPNEVRLAFLNELPGWLRISELPELPREFEPLHWNEVREMAKQGIEFGAHTRSHPILSNLSRRDQIVTELAGSKARIEAEIGQPVTHFCYPNGTVRDFTSETVTVLRECGYRTAVTGEKGINFRDADAFQLLRIHQEPSIPELQFAHQVAGLSR